MDNKNIPELNDSINLFGKISNLFLDRFRIVYLLIAFVFIFGIFSFLDLPKESTPEIKANIAIVQVAYPGASVEDMEILVTDPLEDKIDGLNDVEEINSTTKAGTSRILVKYNYESDIEQKTDDLKDAVDQTNLPEDSLDPFVDYFRSDLMPLMNLSVTGDYELAELKEIAEDIEREVESYKGIDEVDLNGGVEKEVEIKLREKKLLSYGLTKEIVENTIRAKNINIPSGDKSLDKMHYNIRVDSLYENIDQIKNTLITIQDDKSVYIKDVAEVSYVTESLEQVSKLYINSFEKKSSKPVIYLQVYRVDNGDMIKPAEKIHQMIKTQKGKIYPENVDILVSSDMSETVQEDLDNVLSSALSGLLVVIIVLFLFIGLREAYIVSFVIPLSIFTSLILMNTFDISFNVMSSTGLIISLGLLVDNAIVVMENIDRMRDKKLTRKLAAKVALNQVAPAVFAATLTTIAAFFPLALTPGPIGEALKQIPITVMFALGTSFVVSVAITPTLCSRFLETYKSIKNTKMTPIKNILSITFTFILATIAFSIGGNLGVFSLSLGASFAIAMYIKDKYFVQNPHNISNKYSLFVKSILKTRWKKGLVLLMSMVLLIGSFSLLATGVIKSEFMPYETPTGASISVEAPRLYRLKDTENIFEKIEENLYKYDDIKSFNQTIGGDDLNSGSVTIDFVDEEKMKYKPSDLIESIRKDLNKISNASISISGSGGMGRQAVNSPISLELISNDKSISKEVGQKIVEEIKTIDGIVDLKLSTESGIPELEIVIDEVKAKSFGLTSAQVGSKIRTVISSSNLGTMRQDGDEIDLKLNYDYNIETVSDLEKIVFYNNGQRLTLNQIAKIKETRGANKISHKDKNTIVEITSGVKKGVNVNEINQKINEKIKNIDTKGVKISFGGESREMKEIFTEMFKNFLIAIFLVYIILSLQFNSLSQPIVILVSLPLALIGTFIGLFLTGQNFGTYAFMGIVALVGIAVNDAIVLLDFANYQRKHGDDLINATTKAVKTRFIPVFATSITTIAGILPLTMNNETIRQLGVALIFGLIASTFLTLLIIPIVYQTIEKYKDKLQIKFNLFQEEESNV